MRASPLKDAVGHHVWATLRLIEPCERLTPEQLDTTVPGTYGSIIDTMRHLVGADASYLDVTSGGRTTRIDDDEEARMSLADMRSAMERHGPIWAAVVQEDRDPETVLVRRRPDGSETHAPLGIRLAQAIHHGTDHRSQICTALTTLGIEPPSIDVWDFADQDGRLSEVEPSG
jgi:uncharacterized damage-inducible protein DinB